MSDAELLSIVATAFRSLMEHDSDLLDRDVNERSITHKLAEYLQPYFPDWKVDCEYNRLVDGPKRLPYRYVDDVRTDDINGLTIYPDIIIHHRGKGENLLLIEMKKSTNHTNKKPTDKEKLEHLTSDLGEYRYPLGVHLVIDCEKKAPCGVECYRKGARDDSLTAQAIKTFGIS